MKEITERQKDVLNFISKFIEENEYPPTFREMCKEFNISLKGVQDHVKALEKKGYITHVPGSSRSIRVLNKEDEPEKEASEEKPQVVFMVFLIPVLSKKDEKKDA